MTKAKVTHRVTGNAPENDETVTPECHPPEVAPAILLLAELYAVLQAVPSTPKQQVAALASAMTMVITANVPDRDTADASVDNILGVMRQSLDTMEQLGVLRSCPPGPLN